MKNAPALIKVKPVTYNDLYLRLTAALMAAHLIVTSGEPETFFELLKLPAYYPALGASLVIALILVESIYRWTCYLDKQLAWEHSILKRTYAQIAGGILLPLLIDCLLAGVYFEFYGTDIITAGYFKYNFVVIVLLVILFNAYYLIHYLIKLKLKRKPRHVRPLAADKIIADHSDYPVLILMKDGVCLSVNRNDKISYHTCTLEQLYKSLPGEHYFLINRAHIVERSVIKDLSPGRSRTIKLDITSKIYPHVYVSQRNGPAFKEWFDTAV